MASKKKITTNNLPAHSHTFSGNTSSNGEHTHKYNDNTYIMSDNVNDRTVAAFQQYVEKTTSSAGAHTHTFSGTTANTGSGTDYMPPYITVYTWYRET